VNAVTHSQGGERPLVPYQGLEDFYRRRYLLQRARLEDLARELGCAESAVRGDLKRWRLGPDRARSHGARWR
jgi:hypothetical protein